VEINGIQLPTVSVILPVKNEEHYIEKAIRSVRAQQYPQDKVEVIVVDNGSTDRSFALAQSLGARVFLKENCRVGAVRNEGARHASGEVLAFLDSDCEANPLWLSKAVELLGQPGNGLIGGTYLVPENASWPEKAWASSTPPAAIAEVDFLPCSGLVVKAQTFRALNGFDEVLEAAEDDDFSRRIRLAGLKVLSVPECAVMHHGYPKTLKAIARRQIWHGSNQLESATGPFDPLLLLTHAYLLGLASVALGVLTASRGKVSNGLLVMVLIGVIAAVRRVRRLTQGQPAPVFFLQVFAVQQAYFFGRALGLVKNYVKVVRRKAGLSV
jgi:GT2 family glycosyltransferase